MRLTLRTLLAYLDDVLDPADARELGKKVKASEVASGLVHRIRHVTRKLRLGAPKLSGKGMGLDANTVAEYLDSTLGRDQVPDFERICIESDVHLAEVASCHQILTLVLGEPADVPPSLRERVRAIDVTATADREGTESFQLTEAHPPTSDFPAAPPLGAPPQPPLAPAEQPVAVHVHAPAGPPARLEPSIRVLPIAVTLLATFLLALVALVVMGPMDASHPVAGRFFADRSADQRAIPEPTAGPETEPGPASAADPAERMRSQAVEMLQSDRPDTELRDNELPDTPEPNRELEATADPATTAGGADQADPDSQPPTPALPGAGGDELPPDPAPAETEASPENPALETVQPPLVPAELEASGEVTDPSDEAAGDAGQEDGLGGLARYTSDQHVLARWDAESESWFRIRTLAVLEPEQFLVALPTYRPRLLLAPGIQLVLIGPAAVRLLSPDESGVPGMAIEFGRVLAVTDGKSNSHLRLRMGARQSQVAFADADATLALEVRPYQPPGQDPEQQPPHMLIRAFAQDGALRWQDFTPVHAPFSIAANHCADMIDLSNADVHAEDAPDWLDPRSLSLIDRDASKHLEPVLDLERPISVPLLERVSDRLVEVRTLAIRCLASLEHYDPFVDALNQPELRSYWQELFAALQQSLARGPDSARAVRETLERLRGDQGREMYRLLWGYSPQQLEDGGGEQLVAYLESPALDIRILAFENLRQITERTHLYRPEREPKQQKRALVSWARSLRDGEIVHRNPPPSLPPRRALAPPADGDRPPEPGT